MKLELIILGFALMLLCSFFVTVFLKSFYHKRFKNAIHFKGLSSLWFVALGAAILLLDGFSWIRLMILIGLCFGVIGDEILALCQIYPKSDLKHFLGGGVFFVVGHVFYVASIIFIGGPNIITLPIAFAVACVISLLYENKKKFFVGEMKNSLKLYIGIVIFFAAMGIATFLKHGTLATACIALGGILFTVSDNILFAFKFSSRPRYRQNVALHIAYYLAQFALAFSILFI